jgi:hypothetical protein
VTDPADRTYDMLQRVGEFLKKLTQQQYEALVAGEARLDVVPKGARITGGTAKKAPAPVALPLPAEQVAADLRSLGDRSAAAQYIDDLKLSRPQLVLLAGQLNVTITSKHNMPKIRDLIVEQKVGSRLATDAILSRPSAAG